MPPAELSIFFYFAAAMLYFDVWFCVYIIVNVVYVVI